MKRKVKQGDEYDVITGWRRVISWRRGEVAKIKRRMRRRERHEARQQLRGTED